MSITKYNVKASTPEMNAPMSTHPEYVHPDYAYYASDWQMLRDAMAGERRVKEAGEVYLPAISDSSGVSYDEYKERAVYVNMLARTVSGLVGTVFRRPVKIIKTTNAIKKHLLQVSNDNESLNLFTKRLAYELFGMGRAGVLVDRSSTGEGDSFLAPYIAENIVDWEFDFVNGVYQPVYVLLREVIDLGREANISRQAQSYRRLPHGRLGYRFRKLVLENGVYIQKIYKPGSSFEIVLDREPDHEIIPTRFGEPMDFIPFHFFGPMSNGIDVQRSPVYDIATLNISHYRTSAQLEHGRWFTALPIYYVPLGNTQGQAEYVIGPSVVWETPADTKPGLLEYFGTGLGELAKSALEKEEHISQLGGRIMGIRPAGTTESEQVFKMKQANELSILLNVTDALAEGMTKVVRWKLHWDGLKAKDIIIGINQDFKALNIESRELRAIALLYQEGILPLQEVYRIFQDSQFISDEISYEDFKRMILNTDNFPNQPDVSAQQEGYSDADAKLREKHHKREDDLERDKLKQEDRQKKADQKAEKERAQEAAQAKEDNAQPETFLEGQRLAQAEEAISKEKKKKEEEE